MGTTVVNCVCCGSKELHSNQAIWMPFVADRALGLPPLAITQDLGFRSIGEGTGYAMCKTLLCKNCGHLFSNYRFDDNEMSQLYSNYRGHAYAELRESYEPGYSLQNEALAQGNHYVDIVEDFLGAFVSSSNLSILDWGGDTGKNTPFVKAAEVVHIYEPSGVKPQVTNAINVKNEAEFLQSYDLIVLSNVLEHIPFPAHTIEAILPYMSEKTTAYVEVPFEKLQQKADSGIQASSKPQEGKRHWHEHINFFSRASLLHLIEAADLKVLKISASEVNRGCSNVSSSSILQAACCRAL